MANGDPINLTHFSMSAHTGTHVDAQRHFIDGGGDVAGYPTHALVGACRVVQAPRGQSPVTASTLASLVPDDCVRLLIRTDNSDLNRLGAPGFDAGYTALSPCAADWLVDHGYLAVGIDYLSVDPFDAPDAPVHHKLLGAGIAVIEGCDLRLVEPGGYMMVCAPLRLLGADGAPARVFLLDR